LHSSISRERCFQSASASGAEVCHIESLRGDFVANFAIAFWSGWWRHATSHMVTTGRNPAFANSTDVRSPKLLDKPVRIAISSGIEMVHHKQAENWNLDVKKWQNTLISSRLPRFDEGGLMLATRHRFSRNSYFQFHPLHTLFSLLGALILFGMLVWFLVIPAR